MKKKARLVITLKCPRNCSYCCMKYDHILGQMKPLDSLEELHGYEEVMITGGEPMLFPDKVMDIARWINGKSRETKIFLYTAIYHWRIPTLIKLVDGIQYTLHEDTTEQDIENFLNIQREIQLRGRDDQSFRLCIDPNVAYKVGVVPCTWDSIKVKDWRSEEECIVPKDEDFFAIGEIS